MKIQIINEREYKLFPITDEAKTLVATKEQLAAIGKTYKFDVAACNIVPMTQAEIDVVAALSEVVTISARINSLKNELARTDYKAIKYAEGSMSEVEFAPIKAMRNNWRAEIRSAEASMAGYYQTAGLSQ